MKKTILTTLCVLILATWSATLYYEMKDDTAIDNDTGLVETTASEVESIQNHTNITSETVSSTTGSTMQETTPIETTETEKEIEIDEVTLEQLREYRVNENGTIFVVMFHNFIPDEQKDTNKDKEYTMTYTQFRETLQFLYDNDYRPITMDDFLRGDIDVPLGKTPIVLTFDDGWSSQFHFIIKDGELTADPDTAVGIWIDFNKTNSDFALKGTFYVNLGNRIFGETGTPSERLKYLIDFGFEIGSHTYTHEALRLITEKNDLIYQIGKNQKVMLELVPGYMFTSLSLPYGEDVKSDELKDLVVKGNYEGIEYYNIGVLDCKWRPSFSPFSKDFNPRSIYRVRADGLEPVVCDMSDWMLTRSLSKKGQYISDGDPGTVTIPEIVIDDFNVDSVGDKKIISYILD